MVKKSVRARSTRAFYLTLKLTKGVNMKIKYLLFVISVQIISHSSYSYTCLRMMKAAGNSHTLENILEQSRMKTGLLFNELYVETLSHAQTSIFTKKDLSEFIAHFIGGDEPYFCEELFVRSQKGKVRAVTGPVLGDTTPYSGSEFSMDRLKAVIIARFLNSEAKMGLKQGSNREVYFYYAKWMSFKLNEFLREDAHVTIYTGVSISKDNDEPMITVYGPAQSHQRLKLLIGSSIDGVHLNYEIQTDLLPIAQ